METIIQSRGADYNLNKKQKKITAYSCVGICLSLWIYSSANTTDVFINFFKDIPVFGIKPYPGIVFGVILGFGLISCGELTCLYLSVWKRWIILYFPTLIFASISVYVTIVYQMKGNQIVGIKSHGIDTIDLQIKDTEIFLNDLRRRRDEYEEISNLQKEQVRSRQRYRVDPYVHTRWRQLDDSTSLYHRKLVNLRKLKIEKEENIGPIISFSDDKALSKKQYIFAALSEFFILFFGVIGIGLFDSLAQNQQYILDKEKSELVVNGTGRLKKKVHHETFMNDERRRNVSSKHKIVAGNVAVRKNSETIPYGGKRFSDKTIQLCNEVWNNWGRYTEPEMKRSYQNGAIIVSRLLPGQQRINKSTFYRIIKNG